MARPTLYIHPKFRRLVHALQEPVPHVLGYLELLWNVGYQSGDPMLGDALDVELAAQFPGEPGRLVKALAECRLIDEADGRFQIHDLYDHAPDYVQKRFTREQERKRKFSSHNRPLTAGWRSDPANLGGQTAPSGGQGEPAGGQTAPSGGQGEPIGVIGKPPSPSPSPTLNTPLPPKGERRSVRKSPTDEHDNGFALFWEAYPKKIKRLRALKAWQAIAPDAALQTVIVAAVEANKNTVQWTKDGGEYIPHPTSWLNGRQWQDELVVPTSSRGPQCPPTLTREEMIQRQKEEIDRRKAERERLATEGRPTLRDLDEHERAKQVAGGPKA